MHGPGRHQRDARQGQLEAKRLKSELGEAKGEAARLRQEKEVLVAQLRGGSGLADADEARMPSAPDVVAADLQDKLAASEKQRQDVARKMTKAHKRQENLLAQLEAEIEMLSDRVDLLEDECCEAEAGLKEAEERNRTLKVELGRYTAREAIQPVGLHELEDQLEMANEVQKDLTRDIMLRTEELAKLKVEHAVVQEEKEEVVGRLRRSEDKARRLAVKMTKLEVQLADADNVHAEEEEAKAEAFKMALERQEQHIRELEAQLAEAKQAAGAAFSGKKSAGGAKRWFTNV